MKHIELFINALSSGGAEYQLVQLADGLVEKGYDVTIATFGDIKDLHDYNPLIKRCRIAPGKSKYIKMLAIWRHFLTVKVDWVIAFGQRESSYAIEGMFFRSHDNIRIIAGDRNTTYGKPSRIEMLLMNCLYKRADFIVPNSQAQRRHIIETKPEYSDKTITISNYTDLSRFVATPLPEKNTLLIGVFGRYDVQKNCMRFVEAVRVLKEKVQRPFVIEWYGNQHFKDTQPNPFYVEMKEKVIKYGLEDVLVLNDHVKDVAGLMPRFDAICLPSLWEGFSNSISEAICCGKPCMVSDVADNAVMVQDGVNGFLFDPEKIDNIAESFIKYFGLSKEEREAMGKASRKRAEKLFDRERFINAYINLIESK